MQWERLACIVIQGVSEIRLLQIAQDPHLTVTLAVVGGACMAVAATHQDRHFDR